jgi:4-hydroxy-3-methylbut-2-enyl diphosphate reductase
VSPGFNPNEHLQRVGCANQTTMLMSESLRIGEMLRAAMTERYGAAEAATRFRAFDTICSATQERQDAVQALLDSEPLDLAVVIGGYNSSNTVNLARMCAERVQTFHIAEPGCLVSAAEVRHRPIGLPSTAAVAEVSSRGWLPPGEVRVGLTAGASTPNNLVGQVIERLELLAVNGPTS